MERCIFFFRFLFVFFFPLLWKLSLDILFFNLNAKVFFYFRSLLVTLQFCQMRNWFNGKYPSDTGHNATSLNEDSLHKTKCRHQWVEVGWLQCGANYGWTWNQFYMQNYVYFPHAFKSMGNGQWAMANGSLQFSWHRTFISAVFTITFHLVFILISKFIRWFFFSFASHPMSNMFHASRLPLISS